MIVTITAGSHDRNTHLPPFDQDDPRQFAHRWDPDDPEDVAHQASNFITYAVSLGGYVPPIVLIPPARPEDDREWDHIQVNMSDWADLVKTATGMDVEIR